MKTALLMTTFIGSLAAVSVPATGQTYAERVVETLRADGFTPVEVESGPTETRVAAVRDGLLVGVVYDSTTGRIVEQETERFSGDLPAGDVVFVSSDEDFSDLATDDDEDDDDDENDDDDDHDGDDHDGDDDDDDPDSDDDDHDGDDSDDEGEDDDGGDHDGETDDD